MPDVPLLGNVPKGAIFAGGLAVVGVGGYLLYKHMTKPRTVTPPAGAAGYGMAAGYGYGNAYSYGGAYGYGLGGGGLPPYGYGVGQPPLPPTPTSNAAWAQNVTTQLTAQGYAGTDILSALGAYLTGNAVQQGSTQDQIIQAAIAIGGYPPIPGASGFPPAVKYGGQNPGQGGTVNVTASARYDNVTGSWQKVSGATSYDVTLTTHQGSQTVQTTSTAGTSVTFHGLPQKTSFAVHVTAQPGGQTGVAYTTTR